MSDQRTPDWEMITFFIMGGLVLISMFVAIAIANMPGSDA